MNNRRLSCSDILFVILLTCDRVMTSDSGQSDHEREVNLSSSHPFQTVPSTPKNIMALKIFCVEKTAKKLSLIWASKMINIEIENDNYNVFKGDNVSAVLSMHNEASQRWVSLFPWRTYNVSLDVFEHSCMGIQTGHKYTVFLRQRNLELLYLLMTLAGVVLFYSARRLARNVLFYYATGISVGVLASLLVIIFILSRFMPKKSGMYAVIIGGWSMVIASMHFMWEHMQTVLESYQHYILGYFAVAALLSFAVCYYWGPVQNPRTLNLVQWTIQMFALTLVYYGIQIFEMRLVLMLLMTITYLLRRAVLFRMPKRLRYWWWKIYPPKSRMLTEEEYFAQASEETKKALEELRSFCQSPDCNAWKTISRLKSPSRFASFVEGDSHITDDELEEYDSYIPRLPSDFDTNEDELDIRLNMR